MHFRKHSTETHLMGLCSAVCFKDGKDCGKENMDVAQTRVMLNMTKFVSKSVQCFR